MAAEYALDNNTLQSILPEVHGVFSDMNTEKDLATVKKVRKIFADTNQIVTNRELEIKEVVRDKAKDLTVAPRHQITGFTLQHRVEKEEDAASQDHLLTSCISSIKEQEEVKANLENVIQSVNSKKEAQKRQLELTRQEKENLRSKQQDVDKDFAIEIPVNKGLFALYQNITNIRWDAEAPNVKGFVIPDEAEERCEPRVIDLPANEMTQFELVNAVWDVIA